LRETAVKVASRKSYLMTDENAAYTKLGKEFSGHTTVVHSANEYVRLGGFATSTTLKTIFNFQARVIGTFIISANNIYIVISPNSIFAITTAPVLESKMQSEQTRSWLASQENA